MEKIYLQHAEKMEIGESVAYDDVKNIRSIRNACYRIKRDKGIVFKVNITSKDSCVVTRCN